jgi:hypothetical protein
MSVDAQEDRDEKEVHKDQETYQVTYQLLQYTCLEVHNNAAPLQDGG